ncbi:DNA polymerase alpha catalytic subunit [Bienertia sinuspersici]
MNITGKCVEGILDGSLMLLDTSSSALDALGSNNEGIPVYVMSRKKVWQGSLKVPYKLEGKLKKFSLDIEVSFSYLLGKKAASQTHGWSLVARLMKSEHAENDTEVVCIDQALSALSENHSGAETKVVLRQLDMLEKAIP